MALNGCVEVDCVIEAAHADPAYGHLGNQYYPVYCDLGRRRLQEAYGVSNDDLRQRGLGFVVRRAELKYRHEVVPGDRVTIRSCFLPYRRGPLLWMRHEMRKDGTVVFSMRASHVFVDQCTHRAVAPLEELVVQLRR